MKKQILFLLMLLVSVMAVGFTGSRIKTRNANLTKCSGIVKHSVNKTKVRTQPVVRASYSNGVLTVNGVKYNMVGVDGGTFTMGATSEQGSDAYSYEKPAHQVTLSSYHIGQTEVTQELWEAVMGSNPSYLKGAKRPVEQVSWNDCQTFISKLNSLTGEHFRLPTEAEWEYACRGGKYGNNYKYSGSNTIGDVAWYTVNCYDKGINSPDYGTHNVATKKPNELGIYDMTGNVWEWCQDWYGSYSSSAQTNPTGPSSGSRRVSRGGSWYGNARRCCSSYRNFDTPDYSSRSLGFRLAISAQKGQVQQKPQPRANNASASNRTFTVKGISFTMVGVMGGTFTMGATSEQGSNAYNNEKPAHQVTLSSYSIGQTEVTQDLWEAVMGSNPSRFKGAKRPVEWVSWNDCQVFIKKLNELTGETFRLPTEAEWEYACRGGKYSRGYKYSGSNTIVDVAWYDGNSNNWTHNVATKKPNELGIYDMSGNVKEWCQDWYGSYSSNAQTNPTGPSSGSYRVLRGGSWRYGAGLCRSSDRGNGNPDNGDGNGGLRLALPVY